MLTTTTLSKTKLREGFVEQDIPRGTVWGGAAEKLYPSDAAAKSFVRSWRLGRPDFRGAGFLRGGSGICAIYLCHACVQTTDS